MSIPGAAAVAASLFLAVGEPVALDIRSHDAHLGDGATHSVVSVSGAEGIPGRLAMSGGSVVGDVRVAGGGSVRLSGGVIGGTVVLEPGAIGPAPRVEIACLLARYDDDGDAATVPAEIELSTAGVDVDVAHLPGLEVIWSDRTTTSFEVIRGGESEVVFTRSGLLEDLTGDGGVDVLDLALLIGQWGRSGPADFNGDGAVDIVDLVRLLNALQ